LRPHFIDVCRPNWESIDCGLPENPKYIDTYTCTGNADMVKEARLSFPSGHASFSAFTMMFLVLYLQAKMNCLKLPLLRPLLQLVTVMAAMYTALSRISDHKHHWSDVLFGSLLGTTVAVLIVFLVCDNFKSQRSSETCSTILPLHADPARREEE
jgi:phosphatidate phosphatase